MKLPEKLKIQVIQANNGDSIGTMPPDNRYLMDKINEIIDYLDEQYEINKTPQQRQFDMLGKINENGGGIVQEL